MVSERQQLFSGAGAVRPGQELDEAALDRWLVSHVDGYDGPLAVSQFNGGQSNPTYRLETPDLSYVLRRKPAGALLKGAHAVDREYRVIAALHARDFPVARPRALCIDEAVIGSWFYVMDLVEGRIFWDGALPDVALTERAAHFDAMNATIAALHRFEPADLGLGDYGATGNYFERQIGRWSRQYLADEEAGRLPAMDALIEWLPANLPPAGETRIVHGDFRADNMIFHAHEPRVLAVLDWELSTLGDPLADFAYHLMMYRMPSDVLGGFAGLDLGAEGIPSEEEYVAAYCRRTGRDGLPNLGFYMAFNMFRLAGIIHGIKGRLVRGTAASANATSMVAKLPLMAELALAQIQGNASV